MEDLKLVASWHQTLLAMWIKSWHFGNVKSWYNKKLLLNASLSSRHVSPSRWDSPWCSGFGGEGKGGTKGIKQTASRNKWNRRNNWATAPSWPHNLSYLNRECVMTCILLIPRLEESGICVCCIWRERIDVASWPSGWYVAIPPPKIPGASRTSSQAHLFFVCEKYCEAGQDET